MPPRPPPAAPKSKLVRNLVIALLAAPLLCGSCSVLGFLYLRGELGYEDAVERTTGDPRVQQLLGAPVTADFFFSGSEKLKRGKPDDGIAVMSIGLHGSQQDGTLLSSGVKTSGVWGFSKLEVIAANGKHLSLVKQ